MIELGPFNLVVGQPVAVQSNLRTNYPNLVLFNNSQFLIKVQDDSGNTRYIQPLTADVYKLTSSGAALTVSVTNVPKKIGTYVGTFSCIAYDANDGEPTGYPSPLGPFPGGSQLLSTTSIFATAQFDVALPEGANALLITQPPLASFNLTLLEIKGVQTGTIYTTLSGNQSFPLLIPLIDALDTDFTVIISAVYGRTVGLNVYATVVPIPSGPANILAAGTTPNQSDVLTAPPTGAWYITGITVEAPAADSCVFGSTTTPPANDWYFGASYAAGVPTNIEFPIPKRVTTALVYSATASNQSLSFVVWGWPGY